MWGWSSKGRSSGRVIRAVMGRPPVVFPGGPVRATTELRLGCLHICWLPLPETNKDKETTNNSKTKEPKKYCHHSATAQSSSKNLCNKERLPERNSKLMCYRTSAHVACKCWSMETKQTRQAETNLGANHMSRPLRVHKHSLLQSAACLRNTP